MPKKDLLTILVDLVEILEEIPGMEKADVRGNLLSFGFSRSEQSILWSRRSDDLHADLANIVEYAADLERLDLLIANAIRRPQSQRNKDKLKSIKQEYIRIVSGLKEHELEEHNKSPKEFDVFLVHNSQEKDQVRAISEELKLRGLKPWLDEEQILPGRSFQDSIQQIILKVKTAAIFIGPKELGKWQTVELRTFITRCVEADLPVIPVLLPGTHGVPENLLFLKELNWVQFASTDDVEALDRLEWGITAKRPKRNA